MINLYNADAYVQKFYMEHEREPKWVPSGDWHIDDNGNMRHKWMRNTKFTKEIKNDE